MRNYTQKMWIALIIALTFVGCAWWATPAFAQGVTGTLVSVDGNVVTFSVTSDGEYKLSQEGNIQSEVVVATASNGKVTFTMKTGNSAMQLQGVTVTSNVTNWQPCDGAADWLCLSAKVDETEAVTAAAAATNNDEPYNLNGEKGEFVDCGMWYVEPSKKLMTWTGGTNWVHTCFNDPAKDLLEEGYTAEFTMIVKSDVRACRSYWSGEDLDGNQMVPYVPAGCWIFTLRPGTYHVRGWAFDPACGIQIGFRAVPEDADPNWVETKTCDNCVWPFPIAKTQPVYRNSNASTTVSQVPAVTASPSSVPTLQSNSSDAGAQALEEVQALREEFAYFQCVVVANISGTDATDCQAN